MAPVTEGRPEALARSSGFSRCSFLRAQSHSDDLQSLAILMGVSLSWAIRELAHGAQGAPWNKQPFLVLQAGHFGLAHSERIVGSRR